MIVAAGSLIVAVACGGGGGSGPGSPPSTTGPQSNPTPTPPGSSTETITTYAGASIGTQGTFSPSEGDTSTGGQGQTVDGITCAATMSNNYHVHVYLGVYVNGSQVSMPAGVGMENPGPLGVAPAATPGFVNSATCYYYVHTHDQSGIVHVEDPNPSNVPVTGTVHTLQDLFDEWGITVNANQFGPYSGPVRVFTSGQLYRGGNGNAIPATDLTYYGSNAGTVALYSHEVIFIEVGPTWPTTLPNVSFYTQY